MSDYKFDKIEKYWQQYWRDNNIYQVEDDTSKPKFYVLDMFPYPSGAGLHVGHPLGYIASDIYARYKRLRGFNVLHPMGYDSFGLPAEQYAIQTGQHPAITTEQNINRYREQMDMLGFSFDWSRQLKTSEPEFYKWTQWIFMKLYHSWYNNETNRSEGIETLVEKLEKGIIPTPPDGDSAFSANTNWENISEEIQQEILMKYRNAYLSESYVNWCPALGTVLANDEVKDGVSERGGHPVERKLMMQWSMRITSYADRLLQGLDKIDWPEPLKETQRNWIGKSSGSSIQFSLTPSSPEEMGRGEDVREVIEVFTTRPDTIFGVTFVTLAPENNLVDIITTTEYKNQVVEYIHYAKSRSERERQADVKKITGQFTGAYVTHPFTGEDIPVWVGDYVLAGYGTGAVMGVPAHDSRDYAFAKHFVLPIKTVIQPSNEWDFEKGSYDEKVGISINSDFLNGLEVKQAILKAIEVIEQKGLGRGKTNFRLRDAIFGRQRYWGEPIPIYYKDGIPCTMDEKDLPKQLPEVDKYLPTEDGEPPLARATDWTYNGFPLETTTMPGWAGSSWYMFRYMDPHNTGEFASKKALNYWKDVDVYIGGSEHGTGHLLYVRYWTKFLYDMGLLPVDEPAKKLINQGMIQGVTKLFKLIAGNNTASGISFSNQNIIVSSNLDEKDFENSEIRSQYINIVKKISSNISDNDIAELRPTQFVSHRIDINLLDKDGKIKNENETIEWLKLYYGYKNIHFIYDKDGAMEFYSEVEKMSKSKYNVITPDIIISEYGADTLRLYEMFLGPLEQSKPWNTQGIEGVHRFLKKLWGLFYNRDGNCIVVDEDPSAAELKVLHRTIKKAGEDVEGFSFNTSVSAFMICVNEFLELNCQKKNILEQLLIIVSPYAPHICEELWNTINPETSIIKAEWPIYNAAYLVENTFQYPVSVNGKLRLTLELALDLEQADVEKAVLQHEVVQKWTEGKEPKKIVFVKGRIVNVVV